MLTKRLIEKLMKRSPEQKNHRQQVLIVPAPNTGESVCVTRDGATGKLKVEIKRNSEDSRPDPWKKSGIRDHLKTLNELVRVRRLRKTADRATDPGGNVADENPVDGNQQCFWGKIKGE